VFSVKISRYCYVDDVSLIDWTVTLVFDAQDQGLVH